jgi:hypothetical protein
MPQSRDRYVGSMDVDLALNFQALREPGYKTIQQLLLERDYIIDAQQPFIYRKVVGNQTVQVDLLTGFYGGTGRKGRTEKIQDIRARHARGCELALELNERVTISGLLPDGTEDTTVVHAATIPPYIAMKGMAMHDRIKEKDAWDVYFCLTNFSGGLDALVEAMRPHTGNGLFHEGLTNLAEKFASTKHFGPTSVVNFSEVEDTEERERIMRDSFERVNSLLQRLGII